jgi:hypothetical protein
VANWRLMPILATDWPTISSLVTGAGTLVLAVATFAAVRSANRSARIAETALQEQRRPLLAQSRLEDPLQKLMFVDEHWVSAAGGRAAAEHVDGSVYLGISLRNVGSGLGVCQGWTVRPGLNTSRTSPTPAASDEFRVQTRDLYIPAGDIGMWQGALRHPDDPDRAAVHRPGRPPADDHPLWPDPHRRFVAGQRHQTLAPRLGRTALRAGRPCGGRHGPARF